MNCKKHPAVEVYDFCPSCILEERDKFRNALDALEPTMTFGDYLKRVNAEGSIDHSLRCEIQDGRVTFYIHPNDQDGPTIDFQVVGNQLVRINTEKGNEYESDTEIT